MKQRLKMKLSRRGITIPEFALVAVVFFVLSLLAFPMYTIYVNAQRRKVAVHDMKKIEMAIQRLYEDTGTYPPGVKLGSDPDLVHNEDNIPDWQGPYLKHWVHGPPGWTAPGAQGAYQYRNFFYHGYHIVVLWCYGPDLTPEADITKGPPEKGHPVNWGDNIVKYILYTRY